MSHPNKDNEALQRIAEVDRMIHEPARMMLLLVLNVVESADFLFLQRQTDLTKGNLSSHLNRLEDAGYVQIKKEFIDKIPRTLIRITPSGQEAFARYREDMLQALTNPEGFEPG